MVSIAQVFILYCKSKTAIKVRNFESDFVGIWIAVKHLPSLFSLQRWNVLP